MRVGMVGLGKMGGNMVRRLRRGGIEVVGFDRTAAVVRELAAADGMIATDSVRLLVDALAPPRIVWLMLPSGSPTEEQINELVPLLGRHDMRLPPTADGRMWDRWEPGISPR
jgi:6-phosphogluconate dehydrogenase